MTAPEQADHQSLIETDVWQNPSSLDRLVPEDRRNLQYLFRWASVAFPHLDDYNNNYQDPSSRQEAQARIRQTVPEIEPVLEDDWSHFKYNSTLTTFNQESYEHFQSVWNNERHVNFRPGGRGFQKPEDRSPRQAYLLEAAPELDDTEVGRFTGFVTSLVVAKPVFEFTFDPDTSSSDYMAEQPYLFALSTTGKLAGSKILGIASHDYDDNYRLDGIASRASEGDYIKDEYDLDLNPETMVDADAKWARIDTLHRALDHLAVKGLRSFYAYTRR